MRDYVEQVKRLRNQAKLERYYHGSGRICDEAADAIEELLAAVPQNLWTDEPINGSEFMTHVQGGRGFEIHFRTDNAEKYKAVQEECRRQIGHAKPEPPKEVE